MPKPEKVPNCAHSNLPHAPTGLSRQKSYRATKRCTASRRLPPHPTQPPIYANVRRSEVAGKLTTFYNVLTFNEDITKNAFKHTELVSILTIVTVIALLHNTSPHNPICKLPLPGRENERITFTSGKHKRNFTQLPACHVDSR